MKREIKFRAWANKKMYSFDNKDWLIFSKDGYIGFQDTLDGSFQEDSDNCMSLDFALMQYTGLKDKNGKEIYGGDICKIYGSDIGSTNYNSVVYNKSVIRFYGSAFVYGYPIFGGGLANLYLGNITSEFIEVVGNIYENPELLDSSH